MANDFASNVLAGQQYTQNRLLFPIEQQEAGEKLQSEQIANQQANLVLQQQKAFDVKMKALASKQGGAGTSQAADAADQLYSIGQAQIDSGMVEQGAATLDKASTLEKNESENKARLGAELTANATWVENHIDSVHDDASWQSFNMQFMAERGHPSVYANKPYSPQLVAQIAGNVDLVKKNAEIAADNARRDNELATAKRAPLEDALLRARTAAALASVRAHDKNGSEAKPPEGYEWQTDPKTKKPVLDEDGQPVLKPVKGGPHDPDMAGSGGIGGAQAAAQFQRVISGANEALGDVQNIMEMPATVSRGMLPNESADSVLGITKDMLRRKLSSESTQRYQVMSTGIQRNLAAIEATGLGQVGGLTKQMDTVIIQPGDTTETALSKMAQIRQIVVNGLTPLLDNPRVAPKQKEGIKQYIDSLQKAIPFTQHDITMLSKGKDGATLAETAKSQGLSGGPKKISSEAEYKALPGNTEYIAPDGTRRIKPK